MQIRTIAIIAEGIPENLTRVLNHAAQKANVTIIGPATVCTHIMDTSSWFLTLVEMLRLVESSRAASKSATRVA